ncbi:hypothetical protein H1P_3370004 [Hyella patelloides LEGE 07179]|uniref:Filamentous hemagglutinin family outer membrane protein n=1 Tax=Hyella patelloides LEGE 07179 TaxID=945734 RepID=A0A563VVN2_9CYAN|nr:hypothetical protein H1P_3370004 [Hyella patelloides LEGE 07179]
MLSQTGSITINTPKLIIKNNGIISLNNRGIGNSGNLTINTEQLVLDNQKTCPKICIQLCD